MNKVSIITPTYNRSDLIARCIKSVQAQTYKNWELLITDDGSTDSSREVIEELLKSDSRIKYFFQENKGIGAARNKAINNSSGDYIAFLDSDDEWHPEKLEKQISLLEKHKEFDFCYTADEIQYLDTGEKEIKRFSGIGSDKLSFLKLAGIGVSVPSSHVYRRDSFLSVGLFDEDRDLIGLEDDEWSVRGWDRKGCYVDEPLTIYYKHKSQITKGRYLKQLKGKAHIIFKNRKIFLKHKRALLMRCSHLFYIFLKAIIPTKARSFLHKVILKLVK